MADSFQPRFVDLVRNHTTTEGTANFTLGAAVAGYRDFGSVIQPGESFYYSAIGITNPAEFEVGRGTMEADGTISRDPIGGTHTSFAPGNKSVALVAAAEWYEQIATGSLATVATAASAAELSAADQSKPTMLVEPGGEGLFLFDPTDLSSAVAADTQAVACIAPESDPTGASGAWVRKIDSELRSERGFSLIRHKRPGTGTHARTAAQLAAIGGDDDCNVMHWIDPDLDADIIAGVNNVSVLPGVENALADMALAPGRKRLLIPALDLFMGTTGLSIDIDNLVVDARGARLRSEQTSGRLITITSDDVSILGLHTQITAAVAPVQHYRIDGRNFHIHHAIMEYALVQNTPAMDVRGANNDGFTMTHCRKTGCNAFLGSIEGSNMLIAFNEIYGTDGGDDAIAIKAINRASENIRIIGNHVHKHASILAIGSNVGMQGADDPTYSLAVRNVACIGNVAHQCSALVNIKPGALTTTDYRNGLVEGVEISGNVLSDPNAGNFKTGIRVRAGHGAIVRHVYGSDNVIVARAGHSSSSGRNIGALYVHGSGGGATGTIEDVDIGVSYSDPFDGVPNGTAGVPGWPVDSIVYIDPANINLRNVNLRVSGNGCIGTGADILAGGDGAITAEKLKLRNYNTGNGVNNGGFRTASAKILLSDGVSISGGNGSAYVTEGAGSFAPMLATQVSGNTIIGNATGTNGDATEIPCTAAGRALLDDADSTAQRATLGVYSTGEVDGALAGKSDTAHGHDGIYQPLNGQLTSLASLDYAANAGKVIKVNSTEDGFELASDIAGSSGLADGDYGDVTVAGSGTTITIDDGVVTYAKMQQVSASDVVLGRAAAGSGNVEEISCTPQGRAVIAAADARALSIATGMPFVLERGATKLSHTGNTNLTSLKTVTIPGGTIGANGFVEIHAVWGASDNNDSKSHRIEFAGNNIYNVTVLGGAHGSILKHIYNRNSEASQISPAAARDGTGFGNNNSELAVDTSADVTIDFKVQLGNAADTVSLEAYHVMVYPGD